VLSSTELGVHNPPQFVNGPEKVGEFVLPGESVTTFDFRLLGAEPNRDQAITPWQE